MEESKFQRPLKPNQKSIEVWSNSKEKPEHFPVRDKMLLDFYDETSKSVLEENKEILENHPEWSSELEFLGIYAGDSEQAEGYSLGNQKLSHPTAKSMQVNSVPKAVLLAEGNIIWTGNRLQCDFASILSAFMKGQIVAEGSEHSFIIDYSNDQEKSVIEEHFNQTTQEDSQVEELKKRLKLLQNTLNNQENLNSQINQQLKNTENKNKQLENKIDQLSTAKETLQNEIKQLTADKETLQGTIKELETNLLEKDKHTQAVIAKYE